MRELLRPGNIGLVATRQGLNPFSHVFVTSSMVEYKTGSHHRNCVVFPLYAQQDKAQIFGSNQGGPNLAPQLMSQLTSLSSISSADQSTPDEPNAAHEVLHYLYAVLSSPQYRSRYGNRLTMDFPKIPIPSSPALYQDLADVGAKLVALHLMDGRALDSFITTPAGLEGSTVERVSYSDETVWIDKAKTRGFKGVPEEVWNFHIGGYQVCQKWLKDRGPKKGQLGRILSKEDIAHYQKIIVALNETIRIMKEIDEVIDAHGGWPDAFVTKKQDK